MALFWREHPSTYCLPVRQPPSVHTLEITLLSGLFHTPATPGVAYAPRVPGHLPPSAPLMGSDCGHCVSQTPWRGSSQVWRGDPCAGWQGGATALHDPGGQVPHTPRTPLGSFCCPNSRGRGDLSLGGITYPLLFLSPFLQSCHRNTLDSPAILLKSISCIPGTSLLGQRLRLCPASSAGAGFHLCGLVANKQET